jgi:hypothetical protein
MGKFLLLPTNLFGSCPRERKKQKASELEHTVAALTTQLEAMRGVRTENTELQDKNLALVGQLRAREEELERLLREQVGRGVEAQFQGVMVGFCVGA